MEEVLEGQERPGSKARTPRLEPGGAAYSALELMPPEPDALLSCDSGPERGNSKDERKDGLSLFSRLRLTVKIALEEPDSGCAMAVQYAVMGLITFSTVSVILETVPGISTSSRMPMFAILEEVVTFLFTIEILVRVWIADDRCSYLCTCSCIIDMLATMPWYVESVLAATNMDPFTMAKKRTTNSFWTLRMLRMLQMIRLMRVLRLAKAARHSEVMTTVLDSVWASMNGLSALVAFVCMGTVMSATVVFFLESAEPDTDFVSIPAALWWAFATITAVGYGDIVPVTVAGKVAGSFTMVGGVLIISVSVAIITTSFIEQYQRNVQRLKVQKAHFRMSQNSSVVQRGQTEADLTLSPPRRVISIVAEEDDPVAALASLEEGVKEVLLRLEGLAWATGDPKRDGVTPSSRADSPAVRTSLQLLKDQSSSWFRLATNFAEHLVATEAEMRVSEPDLLPSYSSRRNSTLF